MAKERDAGYLLSAEECDHLLQKTNRRLMITRSHLADYADLERSTPSEVLKVLCELFMSLEALASLLRLAQESPPQRYNGADHYRFTTEEGIIIQSLYLPMILELKRRAELHGISLTIN